MRLSRRSARVVWAKFYERGCQDKYSPATGRADKEAVMAASPASVERFVCSGRNEHSTFVIASCGRQKLKSDWRRCLPTMVLFESYGTNAFPGHARGDRVYLGSSAVAETNFAQDPHPRPYPFRIHRRRSGLKLSSCRQISRNGYVVQFSFFGSNVSPFFQIVSATAAILRASVSRAISLRMPLCSKL